MSFKIEKNFQMPGRGGKPMKYSVFAEMEIGDSFVFEENARYKISNAARHFGRNCVPIKKFSTRKVSGGLRIWRIE